MGPKRAVVALARDIKVQTRCGDHPKTFQLEYDDSWLTTEDWHLPYYSTEFCGFSSMFEYPTDSMIVLTSLACVAVCEL